MSAQISCPVPGCSKAFGSTVGLRFHAKEVHPTLEAEFLVRNRVREFDHVERVARSSRAEAEAAELLRGFYARGCPCGRSPESHQEQR